MAIESETPLERLLRHAATEPGMRPEFYRRLLASDVLVPVDQPGQIGPYPAGTNLNIISLVRDDGVVVIPFFTSAARVCEAPVGNKCVQMNVRDLFKTNPGKHFHVNPCSLFGREFVPVEVQSLLKHGGLMIPCRIHVKQNDTAVTLVPLQDPPTHVLDELKVLLARNPQVQAAYIGELRTPQEAVKKSCMLAFDFTPKADVDRILRDVATVITEHMTSHSPHVDLVVRPRNGSHLAKAFEAIAPFYVIGWAGRFLHGPSVAQADERPRST